MTMTIDELFAELKVEADAEHHGIKGQRWGIRRERGPEGTVSSNPAVKTSTPGSPRRLSDADLQAAVQRMRLEREFHQLSAQRVQKGESFTRGLLKDIGKKQVRRVANTAADIAIEKAIAQLGAKTDSKGITEIATRMKPKKKK